MQKNTKQTKSSLEKPKIFGTHASTEAWLNPDRVIRALYVTEQAAHHFESVQKQARGIKRPHPTIMDKAALERLMPKGVVHQGIAVACDALPEYDVHDFARAAQGRKRTVLALLDQVTDPHNVGAILRSASAFGVHGVIMQKKHAPTLDGVLAKTACGAVDHMPVAYETNLSRAIESLQKEGFFAIGFDEHDNATLDSQSLQDMDKIIIMVGSEGQGLRRLLKERCDVLYRLPTQGAIKSLNVSTAAAIAFFAAHKQDAG